LEASLVRPRTIPANAGLFGLRGLEGGHVRRRGRLWITAALVAAALLAGPAAPAWAAEGGGSTTFGRLWAWLAEVLAWEPPPAASSDQCSSIDPNGHCLTNGAAATPDSDQSSHIDPNGVTSDQSLHIDPDG
jgi:hypothetical protein